MSKNTIERFTTYERVLHWFVTGTFFTLLLSGLGLYSRLFTGYFNLFGGGSKAILVHKIAGILFFFSSVQLFLHNLKRTTDFDEDDRTWFKTMGGYLTREETHVRSANSMPGRRCLPFLSAWRRRFWGLPGFLSGIRPCFPAGSFRYHCSCMA